MRIETIINHVDVTDRIASSGQPGIEQFKDISDAGYDAVINLVMSNSENTIPEEIYENQG